MTRETSPSPAATPPLPGQRARLAVAATALALAVIVAGAVAGVLSFVETERMRDLRAWQTRLAIVADSRANAVGRWFATHLAGELAELAANKSLQIYMTGLAWARSAGSVAAAEAAQAAYLRNLLVVTAERSGFSAAPSGPGVEANVRRIGVAGIGLYGLDGRALAVTEGMPPLEGDLDAFFSSLGRGKAGTLDLYRNELGGVGIGYAVPVYRIQGSSGAADQVGWVIGVKPVVRGLFQLLAQPGEVSATAENLLIRHRPPLVEYLSPLADGSEPLDRSFADTTPGLAAAAAVAAPGGFVLARDYREREVLAVSRPVPGLPWLLVSKIDRAEALAETDARLDRFLVVGLLIVALALASGFALWRHGASRRAAAAAARHADVAQRLGARERLLRLVTDSQPGAILIADVDGRVSFANRIAAARVGLEAEALPGKTLAALLGPASAAPRLGLLRAALAGGVAATRTLVEDDGRVVQATHVPLPPDGAEARPSVLIVESDVTEAVTERARRERMLDQLVRTLMAVVDRRDPFAGEHSARASRLARAVAEEMALDEVTVRTAEVAGRLMTLGKILVPADMLVRAGQLSPVEIRQVRDSLQATADLLSGIEFDGPVVETLRQLQERWDGTGEPSGLAGEAILLPARIVAVANAFVAMVSPRAWRDAANVDEAIARLVGEAGCVFDRRVVAATVHYLENRGGRAEWETAIGAA